MTTDFRFASNLLQAFGTTAHSAIGAWRTGGERLGAFTAERWDLAFAQARPKLTPETRRNATHARDVAARYWRQGLDLSTGGAATVVDTLVQSGEQAIARAQAYAQTRGA